MRRRPINSINVVPYLDVLLVLLVIFMITAPLFNQGAVDLPSIGEADAPPPEAGAINVEYHSDATFSVNNPEWKDDNVKGIGEAELIEHIEKILFLRPEVPIILDADKNTPLGDITDLVGKLRKVGGKQIALSVKTGDDKN